MRNGCVAWDLVRRQGASASARAVLPDGHQNIPGGSSTDEQRRRRAKDRQPCGRLSGGRLAALLLSHRALRPCSFVAPCQTPAGKPRTHSSFINRLLSCGTVWAFFPGGRMPPSPFRDLGFFDGRLSVKGCVAQIKKHEESGFGEQSGRREFLDPRKFARCCGRRPPTKMSGQAAALRHLGNTP